MGNYFCWPDVLGLYRLPVLGRAVRALACGEGVALALIWMMEVIRELHGKLEFRPESADPYPDRDSETASA